MEGEPMEYSEAERMVRAALSKKRYAHTCNVKEAAVELAQRYGADPEKAALAALLHDAVKERPKAELLQILRGNAIIAGNAAESPAPVWHGPCAAILAKTQWGVDDPEVLDAIRYHTTGRAGMTKMDKILYLADMISAERDYPEVGELRALAGENLDAAVLQAVRYNIRWMEECGKTIDPLSREALEDLERSAQAQKNTEV